MRFAKFEVWGDVERAFEKAGIPAWTLESQEIYNAVVAVLLCVSDECWVYPAVLTFLTNGKMTLPSIQWKWMNEKKYREKLVREVNARRAAAELKRRGINSMEEAEAAALACRERKAHGSEDHVG